MMHITCKKSSCKTLIPFSQDYQDRKQGKCEHVGVENKAIMERVYKHTHKFRQWNHSKGEIGRRIVMVYNVEWCQ